MNWVIGTLILISILIGWAVWKWYALDSATQESLKRKLGFFSVLLILALISTGLAESPPPVEGMGGGYPIMLPADSLNHAEQSISHTGQAIMGAILGDEATWRSGAIDFLNISELNNSSNLSF
jgi:hypothetical protein